jgi:hypothetical protein
MVIHFQGSWLGRLRTALMFVRITLVWWWRGAGSMVLLRAAWLLLRRGGVVVQLPGPGDVQRICVYQGGLPSIAFYKPNQPLALDW